MNVFHKIADDISKSDDMPDQGPRAAAFRKTGDLLQHREGGPLTTDDLNQGFKHNNMQFNFRHPQKAIFTPKKPQEFSCLLSLVTSLKMQGSQYDDQTDDAYKTFHRQGYILYDFMRAGATDASQLGHNIRLRDACYDGTGGIKIPVIWYFRGRDGNYQPAPVYLTDWDAKEHKVRINLYAFEWLYFYKELSERLLSYKDKREELFDIASQVGCDYLNFADVICPFTFMGMLNRSAGDDTRGNIASAIKEHLSLEMKAPRDFPGIPTINNQKSWFFAFKENRGESDIDNLWDFYEIALRYKSDKQNLRDEFIDKFDRVWKQRHVGWQMTFALFWISPDDYVPLPVSVREYIKNKLEVDTPNQTSEINGSLYLSLIDELRSCFEQRDCPVRSFLELSLTAYHDNSSESQSGTKDDSSKVSQLYPSPQEPEGEYRQYDVDAIVADGCFVDRDELLKMVRRLREKQNLILQGPPGTGKTWLAKKLGFALIGGKDKDAVFSVQFHPSLSYEDFVRGWRPSKEHSGGLALEDGLLLKTIKRAQSSPDKKYVLVIEEINRGNPVQIFGEMLTLLEADKRSPAHGVTLSYPRSDDEVVYIPSNLYVVGTMNLADRSLAMIDVALRRRFAFWDMSPMVGDLWLNWVHDKCQVDKSLLQNVRDGIGKLNNMIESDQRLGIQFRIGHSYVTPPCGRLTNAQEWFDDVIDTELAPLLREYWFDDIDNAEKAITNLKKQIS